MQYIEKQIQRVMSDDSILVKTLAALANIAQ